MIATAILAVVIVAIWFWHSGLAAREAANTSAAEFCQRHGIQFLDGTVAFTSLRVARNPAGGWHLERLYTFDFSVDGMSRKGGLVTVHGKRVTAVDLPPSVLH